MILIDFNSAFLAPVLSAANEEIVDENLCRHIVLSKILHYRKKFKEDYGEILIACDHGRSWRKKVFPHYKAHRDGERRDSKHDWDLIFSCLNVVKKELAENFPYPVISVNNAEADDVIGVIVNNANGPHLIVSADSDFVQLHAEDVQQFSTNHNDFLISEIDPKDYLKTHIIRGDRKDGIPNIYSADDFFVNKEDGKRQKSITQKSLDGWLQKSPKNFCNEEMLRNYKRNALLIDLSNIPKSLQEKILDTYKYYQPTRKRLTPYFVKNQLKLLTPEIQYFVI